MIDYFPLGLALGEAFCNRVKELARLQNNIEKCKPTLISSPRRYGKTSLSLNAFERSGVPYTQADLFSIVSEEDAFQKILKGIGELVGKVVPPSKKAIDGAVKFFSELHIKVAVETFGFSLEFQNNKPRPAEGILAALQRLDQLCQKYDKKVVFFLDEFQTLTKVVTDHSLEAALRQIAQQTKHIVFVFSGSNRHLLHEMFDDSNRPFYKLCDRLALLKIQNEDYLPYLRKVWKNVWKAEIEPAVFEKLMSLSEHHSYYVNIIGSRLSEKGLPTTQVIEDHWRAYLLEEKSQVSHEIDLLSPNQRKLLITLARYGEASSPTSQAFIQLIGMSAASIDQSLRELIKKDYLQRDEQGRISLLDPLIRAVLCSR